MPSNATLSPRQYARRVCTASSSRFQRSSNLSADQLVVPSRRTGTEPDHQPAARQQIDRREDLCGCRRSTKHRHSDGRRERHPAAVREHGGQRRRPVEPRAREHEMVVRAEVCVTEIVRRFRERDQVVERALLAHERDERKVYTELHLSHWSREAIRDPIAAPGRSAGGHSRKNRCSRLVASDAGRLMKALVRRRLRSSARPCSRACGQPLGRSSSRGSFYLILVSFVVVTSLGRRSAARGGPVFQPLAALSARQSAPPVLHGLRLACSTLQIRPPASSVM